MGIAFDAWLTKKILLLIIFNIKTSLQQDQKYAGPLGEEEIAEIIW